jgi:hypothetical protein
VGTDCYYAGSPNYVIFGAMCRLCYDHYTAAGNAGGQGRFTQSKMEYWINFYKGTGPAPIATRANLLLFTEKQWRRPRISFNCTVEGGIAIGARSLRPAAHVRAPARNGELPLIDDTTMSHNTTPIRFTTKSPDNRTSSS